MTLGLLALSVADARSAAEKEIAITGETATEWLDALYDHTAGVIKSGRPVVLQAHVALCDNSILACGAQGDGDNIKKNLYWTTSGGAVGWFHRQRAIWSEVAVHDLPASESGVLQIRVYSTRIMPNAAWKKRGIERPFLAYAVLYGWRGKDIDLALKAYFDDLYECSTRTIPIPGGAPLRAGSQAQLVAYIGHNRMLDLSLEVLPRFLLRSSSCTPTPKGMIAVACLTASFLGRYASAPSRVPLLLTDSLLFAGTHAFEGAARAFLQGASLAEIRTAGASAYAEGQGKPLQSVSSAFVNPSYKSWRW